MHEKYCVIYASDGNDIDDLFVRVETPPLSLEKAEEFLKKRAMEIIDEHQPSSIFPEDAEEKEDLYTELLKSDDGTDEYGNECICVRSDYFAYGYFSTSSAIDWKECLRIVEAK